MTSSCPERTPLLVLLILLPCLVVLGSGGLAFSQDIRLKMASFIPQWVPQAQFAGYFVAHEKGIYRKNGIDLTLLRGGPVQPASELLEKGAADFGTLFLSTGVLKRAQGVKLVNLAQVGQQSSLMLVAKKSAGIDLPEGMNCKKVGLWGPEFQVQPRAFFRKYNLTVTVVPQSTTLNLFLRGGVDVCSAMGYNEYHLILNAGLDREELTTFLMSDHGLNFPEDGIYCLEQTYRRDPELCRQFVKSSLEGWEYAFKYPEEALSIVMRRVQDGNAGTNRVHQRWMLDRMKDVILYPDGRGPLGILKPEDYEKVTQEYLRSGLIRRIPSFSEFCVNLSSHD
jgi:NitT/TauT family transport system substrate-binding protein